MTTAPPSTPPVIPTWFDNVLYRSRTEARWAKFFTELGVTFEYETEGFMPEGVWYLPDFIVFAATGPIWVEIKPTWHAPRIDKWRHFASHPPKATHAAHRAENSRSAVFVGPPQIGEGHILVMGGSDDDENPLHGPWEDDTQEWRPCGSGAHFDLAYAGTFRAKFAEDGCADDFGGNGVERLEKAIRAARSARFQKGAA